jgi:uncharacterized damage-inducible protein DinB
MLEALFRLLDHMVWADAQVEDALRTQAAPPERALALYAHVLGTEHEWLARIEGRPSRMAIWPTLGMAECPAAAREVHTGYRAFLSTLQAPDLRRRIAYTNSAGKSFETPLGDILLHVFMHGSYHRGQVAQLMRESGAPPNPTDYITFVRR